jgi:hypothetical protein
VIESLSRVLRMTPPEREHLFTVAGLALPPRTVGPPEVDDTLRRLVQALDPSPAFVANPWWDLLTYNETYSFLHGGLDTRPAAERNVLWLFFATDPARSLIVNWPEEARQLVGQLRARLAQYPGDPRGPELVAALTAASPKFAELWQQHTTARFRGYRKSYQHPTRGTAQPRHHRAHRFQQRAAAPHRAAASRPGHGRQARPTALSAPMCRRRPREVRRGWQP